MIRKTTFRVPAMDCPSEEQMIRMKLDGLPQIQFMEFDIANRRLVVYHLNGYDEIFQQLSSLNFGGSLVESVVVHSNIPDSLTINNTDQERKILWQVLAINGFFFLLELAAGFLANSMGLVADSLDMLADSIVYGLALFAVRGTTARKKSIAAVAGYFQIVLALAGFIEVVRRFIEVEIPPSFQTMMVISLLALVGNGLCLYLLQKTKSNEAHLQASMIFTSNDVIANIGVIVAGGLVYLTGSSHPDLVVGAIVFVLVGKGAWAILKLSR